MRGPGDYIPDWSEKSHPDAPWEGENQEREQYDWEWEE